MRKYDIVHYCEFQGLEAEEYWKKEHDDERFRKLVAVPYRKFEEFPHMHSSRLPARTIEIDGKELQVCRNCFYNLVGSAPSWLNAGKVKSSHRTLPAIKRINARIKREKERKNDRQI